MRAGDGRAARMMSRWDYYSVVAIKAASLPETPPPAQAAPRHKQLPYFVFTWRVAFCAAATPSRVICCAASTPHHAADSAVSNVCW